MKCAIILKEFQRFASGTLSTVWTLANYLIVAYALYNLVVSQLDIIQICMSKVLSVEKLGSDCSILNKGDSINI